MNSTRNIMALIEMLLADGGDIGVRELGVRTGIPKSTVQRFLASMEENGWVSRDRGTRGYRIGYKLLGQSIGWMLRLELQRQSQEILDLISSQTGLTSALSTLDGWNGLTIASGLPGGPEGPAEKCLVLFDLHASASGRALLAFAPEPLQKYLIYSRLKAYTERTLTTPKALQEALDDVRQTRYAYSAGENVPEMAEVAVPLLNPDDSIMAALSLRGPEASVTPDVGLYVEKLRGAAAEIIERMADL